MLANPHEQISAEPIGSQAPFSQPDAPGASFFTQTPVIMGERRDPNAAGGEELARVAQAMRMMLGVSPGTADYAAQVVDAASWRDKRLVARIIKEAAPNTPIPWRQRIIAYVAGLIF